MLIAVGRLVLIVSGRRYRSRAIHECRWLPQVVMVLYIAWRYLYSPMPVVLPMRPPIVEESYFRVSNPPVVLSVPCSHGIVHRDLSMRREGDAAYEECSWQILWRLRIGRP